MEESLTSKADSAQSRTAAGRACQICGAGETVELSISAVLRYWTCSKCFYSEKIPVGRNAHDDFVSSQAAYYENPSANPFLEPASLQKERMAQKSKIARKYIGTGSAILEVGPGGGSFLRWARDNGYECVACEHSSIVSNKLRALGFDVAQGEFEKADFGILYDAVFSFHIIEHVESPERHLAKAFAIVRPGGYMIVATPNAASWQQRLFPKLSFNFDAAHLHVLSPQSLGILAARAGWSVEERKTPEYTMNLLRFISKIVRKVRGEDENLTAGKYSSLGAGGRADAVIAIIARLTAPFRYLQSLLGGGNEVLIVLRKPS